MIAFISHQCWFLSPHLSLSLLSSHLFPSAYCFFYLLPPLPSLSVLFQFSSLSLYCQTVLRQKLYLLYHHVLSPHDSSWHMVVTQKIF